MGVLSRLFESKETKEKRMKAMQLAEEAEIKRAAEEIESKRLAAGAEAKQRTEEPRAKELAALSGALNRIGTTSPEDEKNEHRTPTELSTEFKIERVDAVSTSFVSERMLAILLGHPTLEPKSIVLMFKSESAARQADTTRAQRGGSSTPLPASARRFSDDLVALEYFFPENSTDASILSFCRLFENLGVEVALVNGCSQDTQKRIISILGMKEGLSM